MTEETTTTTADTTQTTTTTADSATVDTTTTATEPSFIESLGDGYQGNEAFNEITDAKTLADKYLEQGKALGELQAKIPQTPESADKYTAVNAPDGVVLSDELSNAFKETAHELGMTDEQYQKVVSFQYEAIQARNELMKKEYAETMATMKKEMGDKFDGNVLSANKILQAIPELKSIMGEADPSGEYQIVRSNPNWFKALVSLGQKIQVDRLVQTSNQTQSGVKRGIDGSPALSYPEMKK